MRKLLFPALLCIAGIAHAQKIPNPEPFAKNLTAADLKKHLYIVASKDFEGRETATEGQRKAAAYIENHFRSLGLLPGGGKDSYQLVYPVFQDSMTETGISINGQSFTPDQDFYVNPASNYTATLLGSEVVFAGYGISDSSRDDYKGLDVRGKIVLVLNGTPNNGQGAAAAQPARGRRGFAFFAKQE